MDRKLTGRRGGKERERERERKKERERQQNRCGRDKR